MNNTKWCFVFSYIVLIGTALIMLPGCKGAKELPTKKIRQKLREFGGLELPRKANGLRAILSHSRDPGIFVRFETDSEGIEHVLKTFGKPGTKSKTLDPNDFKEMKKFGGRLFPQPCQWQEMVGVRLFDQESVESGRLLEYMAPRFNEVGYEVFIDDKTNTVYVHAYFK